MIRTLNTAAEVEAVFLHPEVAEAMRHGTDWSGQAVLDRGCRVWGFDVDGALGGAFIVSPQPDGRAQLHVGILPHARGDIAVAAGRAALECEVAAGMRVYGRTPKHRPDALAFAVACGMAYVDEDEFEWITEPAGADEEDVG